MNDWASFELPSRQTGTFDLHYFGTVSEATVDGVFFLSDSVVTDWPQAPIATRFSGGNIEAANGTTYGAVNPTPFTPGQQYCVHFEVDVPQNVYNMFVSSNMDCSDPIIIADNYSFRVAATSISYYTIRHTERVASGTLEVCDISLGSPAVTSSSASTTGVGRINITSTTAEVEIEVSNASKLQMFFGIALLLLLSLLLL